MTQPEAQSTPSDEQERIKCIICGNPVGELTQEDFREMKEQVERATGMMCLAIERLNCDACARANENDES